MDQINGNNNLLCHLDNFGGSFSFGIQHENDSMYGIDPFNRIPKQRQKKLFISYIDVRKCAWTPYNLLIQTRLCSSCTTATMFLYTERLIFVAFLQCVYINYRHEYTYYIEPEAAAATTMVHFIRMKLYPYIFLLCTEYRRI